ncbi:glucan 1,3-beta-glucosidase [Candidatus Saccharibacteria bacterium]|nr:MAG: glucan 1,3-beta-glucosidase [Candidatus Saccharibacteria bacterium]
MIKQSIKGVNLGGWLVLERWITPSIFSGCSATDETSLCRELGAGAKKRLRTHFETYITKEDFIWLKEAGVSAVRIPVGYWIFGDEEPYVGAIDVLDNAMRWAAETGIKVIIDLHTAPGSQNGWDHSGLAGEPEWFKDQSRIDKTVETIDRIAARYHTAVNLIGIELLNEPRWDVPLETLVGYYKAAYEAVRRHSREDVMVIVSDAFRPAEMTVRLQEFEWSNLVLDCHLYQVFSQEDKSLTTEQHIEKTFIEWKGLLQDLQQTIPVIVGEWSIALDEQSLSELTPLQKEATYRAYAAAQMYVFENAHGWFYWTYKTEGGGNWSFKQSITQGKLFL